AASLFACALVVGAATKRFFYSALLMSTPGIMVIGRLGTPDALSSFAVVGGCVAVIGDRLFTGILVLMLSMWIRTDNVLFVIIGVAWLAWRHKIRVRDTVILALLALGSVSFINSLSGNYGWKVLFQYSFIGGRYPAGMAGNFGFGTYARVALENLQSLGP